jgi:hypothetical protein
MLFIPFGLASGLIFAGFLTLVFAVELFVDEVYDGPFKSFVVWIQRDNADSGLYANNDALIFIPFVFQPIHANVKVAYQL